MQQKKTDTTTIDIDTLEDLTEQERHFCDLILKGMSASDAYMQAIDTKAKLKSIWVLASRLRNSDRVKSWLIAARAAGFGSTLCNIDEHLTELGRLRDAAEASGNYGAAVQAEQLRGKVRGHYIDKIEDVTKQSDPAIAIRQLAQLVGNKAALEAAQSKMGYSEDEAIKILGIDSTESRPGVH